ncbi:biotin-dependent carboxyltransferase family protein [Alteromonas sp. ALT199]|uniref:5-oxoprolinase subunit C family protein n=1 Tax=unclassified Alteromonas TaxID=2614992 RepID=UPI001BE6AC2A|nr:biotin-dependent carboxyltransferase family protein [Alteromonas sp. ALT199]MBT3134574.1 biotin-dependent carboxyltransferase family protein [Alteromonas sp. ALT199]
MRIEVLSKGLFALIIDNGRVGRQRDGFCESGPMDSSAYDWANFLAFNLDGTPCIEAIGEMQLRVDEDCIIAVTGREPILLVDGNAESSYQSQKISAGSTITFGSTLLGSKAYLAICGNWQVPKTVGSACTVVREKLGGLDGKGSALKDNDCFEVLANTRMKDSTKMRRLSRQYIDDYGFLESIRVVPGYQFSSFSNLALRTFETSKYTVSSSIDRMGFRFTGEPVASDMENMRSEAIHLGAIQVPSDGQPIVMMRDRQTLGGYPKLGCVSPCDINRLAQAVPGEKVNFTFQDEEEARADWLLMTSRRRRLQGEIL